MCGIVGYTGTRQAAPLLLEGLRRLEYRGYDSAGLALIEDGRIEVHKAAGKISVLEKALGTNLPAGHTGIAHTRWATHGAPNTVNAHPHTDCGGTLALIHNGIIENAGALRTALGKRGHVFRSETDTEVLVHLIEELFAGAGSLVEAVAGALHQVEGTYGIAVVSTREPDTIVAARGRISSPPTPRPCWPRRARWSTWTMGRSRWFGPRTTASSISTRWRRKRR
jgi:glucosamine--fructose-6-phosphate aminotransferase (isomerizing)